MIPANLVDTCDLLREQSQIRIEELKKHSDSKLVSQHLDPETVQSWSRRKAVGILKQAVNEDYSIRGLLRPLVQHYQYICQTLQIMSPPQPEGSPLNAFQSHLSEVIPFVKLPGLVLYIIPLDSFLFLLEYSGLLRINR